MPSYPRATLSEDDLREARSVAKGRKDRHARFAIGELALSRAVRRPWKGAFTNIEKWDSWKGLGEVDVLRVSFISNLVDPLVVPLEAEDTAVYVLATDRDAPTFSFLGWVRAFDAKQDHFLDAASGTYHVPVAELTSCWELRSKPTGRKGGARRLNAKDPADDFAGAGPVPYMLDSDDGRHPADFGQTPMASQTNFRLPCRRCQQLIEPTDLAVSAKECGLIHGDPEQCGFDPAERKGGADRPPR